SSSTSLTPHTPLTVCLVLPCLVRPTPWLTPLFPYTTLFRSGLSLRGLTYLPLLEMTLWCGCAWLRAGPRVDPAGPSMSPWPARGGNWCVNRARSGDQGHYDAGIRPPPAIAVAA